MKNIQVSDEMYDFLMNLSNEINSQDHRSTRMPYFFQVQETLEILAAEGSCGTEVWICDGDIALRTETDIKEAVFEYKEWDLENDDDLKKFDDLQFFEIESILEKNYKRAELTTTETYSNSFLTEKACKEHIRLNKHNYSSPIDYLSFAYRNPEMEKLFEFLCGLTNKQIHT